MAPITRNKGILRKNLNIEQKKTFKIKFKASKKSTSVHSQVMILKQLSTFKSVKKS